MPLFDGTFLKRLISVAKPILLEFIMRLLDDLNAQPGVMQSPIELRQKVSAALDQEFCS